MEGSRKFIAMWLGILGSWVIAKYGPQWGGVFATVQMIALPFLASVAYMLYNYLQKTTADKFVPENWLAGKRTFIGLLTAILAPILVSATAEVKDAVAQTVTAGVELLIPVAYMIFQSLSDKKMAANPASASITNTTAAPVIYSPIAANPQMAASAPPPSSKPMVVYQYADVEAVASEIITKYPGDPLAQAYRFYEAMNNWDLRLVQPKDRVKQAKEFVAKSKQLFWDGFKQYTKLDPPSDADLANKATVLYKIKKDYEKVNGLVCSGKTFSEINSLIESMDDFLGYDQAFTLIGNESENLDWGVFSGRGYSSADVPQYAGALVKDIKEP